MHSGKQIAQTCSTVNKPGQNDADNARAEKHGREHEDTGQPRKGLVAEKVWYGHEEGANPGTAKVNAR